MAVNCAPQLGQKVAPLAISVPHFGQRIPIPNSVIYEQILVIIIIVTENRNGDSQV